MVEIDNVWKRFGRFEALEGMTLAVPEGSTFALIGPNGAGKSTTIKIVMNLIKASHGTARVLDTDSRKLSAREFAQIGYVAENQELPPRITVGDYVAYLRPFYATWDRNLEASLLAQLDLPVDRKIGHLSHGMRIKMALVCALAYRPKLLVLDEPFSGLDPLVRKEFMETVLSQTDGTTILISSHELAELEHTASHVAFMNCGKVVFQDSMDALTARVRKVHVTLEQPATIPENSPREWLDVHTAGNMLSFIDPQFTEIGSTRQILDTVRGVREITSEPVELVSIFTTFARAARGKRVR